MITTGVVCCDVCGLTYCSDLPEDRAEHSREHRRTLAILARYPDYVPTYREREALKMAAGDDLAGIEDVIRAHWSRSLEAWGSVWRRHPDLPRYRQAWLAAEVDRDDAEEVEPGVAEAISLHGAKPSRRLSPGSSYWARRG